MSTTVLAYLLLAAGSCLVDISCASPHARGSPEKERQRRDGTGGNTNISATRPGGEDFVFPDTNFKPRLGSAKVPSCANGTTFCLEAENYPTPYLANVLKNELGFKEFFGTDKTDFEVKNRLGDDDGMAMCSSQEKLIFPKVGQNKDDEWMYIVNLDKEYVQGVRIELCNADNTPCHLSDGLPPGYTTSCKQKFIYRKLLAVSDNGKAAPDSFKLPSCCACFYHTSSVANRLRGDSQSELKPRS